MKVSIIVPTFGRPKVISDFLKSLYSLRKEILKPYEVIVVNNNNKELMKKTSKVCKSYDLPIVEIKSKPLGSAGARNAGIKKATGEFLFFFDDDTLVQKGYFRNILKHYRDSKVGAVGGSEDKGKVSVVHNIFFRFKKPGSVSWCGGIVSNFSPKHEKSILVKHLHGSNFSISKTVIEKIGLMDGVMEGHYRDETDYTYRVFEKKYKVVFEPRARVIHTATDVGGNVSPLKKKKWAYWYHRNTSYFFFKHLFKGSVLRLLCYLLAELLTSIVRAVLYNNVYYLLGIFSIIEGYNLSRKSSRSLSI